MATDVELVKMSGKGQLVVPQDIRELLELRPGERFVAFPVKDGILFKKVEIPKVKMEWKELSAQVQKKFKRLGVKKKHLNEAIAWGKRRSS